MIKLRLRKPITAFAGIGLLILMSSWGDIGHSMISRNISGSFNNQMAFFSDWVGYLAEHASDADNRKKDDPEEFPKHFIDVDNYESFQKNGSIPQSLEDCKQQYGSDFVEKNGTLPWATLAMYDSLVQNMKRRNWPDAKRYAADLGHYVADGHMPLHLTNNYDGQLTGNKGIHARYEIDMIKRFQDKIAFSFSNAKRIKDVRGYVFNYMYENYPYAQELIDADDTAKDLAGNSDSDVYYQNLWDLTEEMTQQMFSAASHAYAEMLYTAWIEAGRPIESGKHEI